MAYLRKGDEMTEHPILFKDEMVRANPWVWAITFAKAPND